MTYWEECYNEKRVWVSHGGTFGDKDKIVNSANVNMIGTLNSGV